LAFDRRDCSRFGFFGFRRARLQILCHKSESDRQQTTCFIHAKRERHRFVGSETFARRTIRRINILLVGLAGKNYPGANLTDSIIVASINPKTYQTALLSIPRDLYVQIPDTKSYTKINALYARAQDADASGKSGINDLEKTIADITSQPIDYYIALDFDGFRQIINELGGIKVQVPKDLHDERYPGQTIPMRLLTSKPGSKISTVTQL